MVCSEFDDDDIFEYDDAEDLDDSDDGDFAIIGDDLTLECLPSHIKQKLINITEGISPLISANSQLEHELIELSKQYSLAISHYDKVLTKHNGELLDKMLAEDLDEGQERVDDPPSLVRSRADVSTAFEKIELIEKQQQELVIQRKKILLSLAAKVLVHKGDDKLLREITSLINSNEKPASSCASIVFAKPQKTIIYSKLTQEIGVSL